MTIGIPENPLLHLETIFTQKSTVSDLILKNPKFSFFQKFRYRVLTKPESKPKILVFFAHAISEKFLKKKTENGTFITVG